MQINAATTKQHHKQNDETKNTFSEYCDGNTKTLT
jgi:hypothetical protein